MEYSTVSPELLDYTIVSMIRGEDRSNHPTPKHAKTIVRFSQSAFYQMYGDDWGLYTSLRDKVIDEFNHPDSLSLVDGKLVFRLSTNNVNEQTLAILSVYFNSLGWKNMSVRGCGFTNVKYKGSFSRTYVWEFTLEAY